MELYNSKPKLTELETRINEAIRRCKKTKEVCGLRMLIAQIKVVEGNTLEAIRICEKVVKDDPKDFRVYLFQGLVYSLMKKGDEAAKQFEHVARLLLDDPYIVTATVNNAKKVSEWRVIVGYDSVYCYLTTFAKLLIVSALEKFS
ncbi:Tetratricopeptide repeat (TPR)-like superfamily protein [Raphanus sativus]|nr:Tetratricopeptide repeat (TPR)-like superfamily protein [Raphanus sativus]